MFRHAKPALCTLSLLALAACGSSTEPGLAVALHLRPLGYEGGFAVNIGETLALEAIPVAADSTFIGTAITAHWSSADTAKAVITDQGILHTRCVGTVRIDATGVIHGQSITGHLPVAIGTVGAACAP